MGEERNVTETYILVVEDDPDLRSLVIKLLERERFTALTASSGAEMRQQMAKQDFDLILLDVRLPDSDGFDLLRELRATSDVAIVMLTGMDTAVDRVLGLEFGADDYVCKPFEPRELVARVKSVLRRSQNNGGGGDSDANPSTVFRFEGHLLDLTHRTLHNDNNDEVELTSGEFDLLSALVETANRPLTRDQLLDRTRAREWSPFDRSIDVLIGRIRRKIEVDPAKPKMIKTVRTIGYVFAAKVDRLTASTPD
jgi:DNA-binding response OmpR family regulator|tara:strand:+ start:2511 stop:3269 length:759 start_codon:yes stop_codon:yes gene_type:complete